MRGIFYCEGFIGIGHFVRALKLSQELQLDHTMTLLHKPLKSAFHTEGPNLHSIAISPDKGQRERQLAEALKEPCDFFFTEQFPFGKRSQEEEVLSLIEKIKKKNREALIICSYRGCSFRGSNAEMEKQSSDALSALALEERVVLTIKRYYDYVFVHTDPNLIQLNETFYLVSEIAPQVVYTGFVTADPLPNPSKREKEILVIGNGKEVGTLLLHAMLPLSSLFPDYKWRFVVGPYLHKEPLFETLKSYIEKECLKNATVETFIHDINAALSRSSLAITSGGTIVFNHYLTKTRALVLPDPALPDQCFLSEKFDGLGGIEVIQRDSFNPESMAEKIRSALAKGAASYPITLNMDGAKMSHLALNLLLDKVERG